MHSVTDKRTIAIFTHQSITGTRFTTGKGCELANIKVKIVLLSVPQNCSC